VIAGLAACAPMSLFPPPPSVSFILSICSSLIWCATPCSAGTPSGVLHAARSVSARLSYYPMHAPTTQQDPTHSNLSVSGSSCTERYEYASQLAMGTEQLTKGSHAARLNSSGTAGGARLHSSCRLSACQAPATGAQLPTAAGLSLQWESASSASLSAACPLARPFACPFIVPLVCTCAFSPPALSSLILPTDASTRLAATSSYAAMVANDGSQYGAPLRRQQRASSCPPPGGRLPTQQ